MDNIGLKFNELTASFEKMKEGTPIEFFRCGKWRKGLFVLCNKERKLIIVRDYTGDTWHITPEALRTLKIMGDNNPNQTFKAKNSKKLGEATYCSAYFSKGTINGNS